MGDQAEGSERTSGDRSFWTIRVGLGAAIVVLIAGGVMWRLQATPPAVSPSPVPSHSPLTPLSGAANSPTAAETLAPTPSASPSTGSYPELAIPQQLRHVLPLPVGAEIADGEVIAAAGDWLVTNLSFLNDPPGHQQQLYAVNISSGAARRLADHYAEASIAGNRVAWLDPTCQYKTQVPVGGSDAVCTEWKLHLTDLASGSDRIVASGSITEGVTTPIFEYGDGEDVAPRTALSADTLAYSTGDLVHGFTLHLLTLSSGAERTVGLGGMVDEMRWAGGDLTWIEDTDLRHDGLANGLATADYYTGTRLMLLPAGATQARQIPTTPFWLEADSTGVTWENSNSRSDDVWRAAAPDWQPVHLATSSTAGLVGVSSGWAGWTDEWVVGYLVLRPHDSGPHVIPDGFGLSGGWLFLSKRDESTLQHTDLEAVPIADLN
jgi:hypothetical protein